MPDREQVAKAVLWHDAWTPLYAGESATRCGIATTMRRDKFNAAAKQLGVMVGWSINVAFMHGDGLPGDLSQGTRTAFFFM